MQIGKCLPPKFLVRAIFRVIAPTMDYLPSVIPVPASASINSSGDPTPRNKIFIELVPRQKHAGMTNYAKNMRDDRAVGEGSFPVWSRPMSVGFF